MVNLFLELSLLSTKLAQRNIVHMITRLDHQYHVIGQKNNKRKSKVF